MQPIQRLSLVLTASLLVVACGSTPPAAQEEAVTSALYTCESGVKIVASYSDTDTATVHYQGRTYSLKNAVSASGARYVGDGIEWWTKGAGRGASGSVLQHLADGTSGAVLETCTQE
ncbi:Uncharacterised protein [uncultured Comamonas sp.]|nr:Uncharacterised protein [uncultured Comamonas sp.]